MARHFARTIGALVATCVLSAPAGAQDGGGFSFGNLKDALSIALQNPSGMGQRDGRAVTDPALAVRTEFYGHDVRHPGLVKAGGQVDLLQNAVAGYPFKKGTGVPGTVTRAGAAEGCVPSRAPAEGEIVANIHVGNSEATSQLHVLSTRQMADLARHWAERRINGAPRTRDGPKGDGRAARLITVTVTETDAPVYLILQSAMASALWSVQTAPGVQIAHVAVIGPHGQALHGQAALAASQDFLPVSAECAPQPWRMPAPHWGLYSSISGQNSSDDYEGKARTRATKYDAWFSARFGQPAETEVIGAYGAAHVLVGPMPQTPEARVQWAPVKGARILVGPVDHVLALPEAERRAELSRLQREMATLAIGGDLTALTPAPLERDQ